MAELQEDFYKQVGWPVGLMRGQSREETRARHTPHTLAAKADQLEAEYQEYGRGLAVQAQDYMMGIKERESAVVVARKEIDQQRNLLNAAASQLNPLQQTAIKVLREGQANEPEVKKFYADMPAIMAAGLSKVQEELQKKSTDNLTRSLGLQRSKSRGHS
jgi:hypothetical protein